MTDYEIFYGIYYNTGERFFLMWTTVDHSGSLVPFIDVICVLFFHFDTVWIFPNPLNWCNPIRHSMRRLRAPDHLFYPHNTVWQCQLTLALLLWHFSVSFGGLTHMGWHTPGFSAHLHPNPPKPLPWVQVQVWVALEYPRVTHDNHYISARGKQIHHIYAKKMAQICDCLSLRLYLKIVS